MKKILILLLLLILVLLAIVIFNTINFKPSQSKVEAVEKIEIRDGAALRLAEAISIRTVSFEDEADFDSTQFQLFNSFIADNYPNLFDQAEHTIFNSYSHLFKLKGSDISLEPVILMAHHDVVPIASPALWSVHPFTDGIKNDTIYGRGAIDDKAALIGILEAIEQLLVEGFLPKRSVFFAFGHDEEVSGQRGAVEIVNHLKKQNIQAAFVLDEGGALTKNLIPGVEEKTAIIGIAEKGYTSFELTTTMMGGHSSQPAKETSIDVLATAISKLKANPLPSKITPVLDAFMDQVGPHMDFKSRLVFANRWLFKTLLLNEYEKFPQGNATVRTTTSPTIFEAGIKENVIPTASRAVVNFRIMPGETIETVKDHILKTIDDDRVKVAMKGKGSNPSPISPYDNEPYRVITQSIKELYPNTVTTPNLLVGATDSRHYTPVSKNIYRFSPIHMSPKNINCFHGVDEHISVLEFENAIRFYRQIIVHANEFL
jgi:carboxypeptidase PM20D1